VKNEDKKKTKGNPHLWKILPKEVERREAKKNLFPEGYGFGKKSPSGIKE